PTTVVHSRTIHRFTVPLVTYGSVLAKFSATSGDSPLKSNTAPSIGLANAPPKPAHRARFPSRRFQDAPREILLVWKRSRHRLRRIKDNALECLVPSGLFF